MESKQSKQLARWEQATPRGFTPLSVYVAAGVPSCVDRRTQAQKDADLRAYQEREAVRLSAIFYGSK